MNSFVFDFLIRNRLGGQSLIWSVLSETALTTSLVKHGKFLAVPCAALTLNGLCFATGALSLRATQKEENNLQTWKQTWAVTLHERLRLRCLLDAVVAALYGLEWDDLAWILRDCAHPVEKITNKAFARELDPKGFWRIDKDQPPELRHTVLTLAAFADLKSAIAAAGGDLEHGIEDFCTANDSKGWMLPDTLCLADLGLDQDERAQYPQPVREKLGPRFLPWQLEQSQQESWAECERHARNLLGAAGYEAFCRQLRQPAPDWAMVAETSETYTAPATGLNDEFQLVAPDYTPQGKLPF